MRKLLAARSAACASRASLRARVAAQAQSPPTNIPNRQIRIIVPYPPGGSVDVLGRLIAQRMQENWGQTVIVENRPGAGTMIGTAAAAKSDPDGYTLIDRGERPHHQSGALCEDAVRRDQGLRADRAARAHAGGALRASRHCRRRTRKELVALGKAKTAHAQLRLGRHRQHDAPDRRIAQDPRPASRCCTSSIAAARRR